MKHYTIYLMGSDGQLEWETTLWLEYEPSYLFHDDGVYSLQDHHPSGHHLTYEYAGNALAV